MDLATLEAKHLAELHEMARELSIENYNRLRKRELIFELLKVLAAKEGLLFSQGVLEILADGFGFLRVNNYTPGPDDIYVSSSQVRRFNLRTGDLVSGQVRPPKDNEKYFALLKVQAVNLGDPEALRDREVFEEMTPIYPHDRLRMEVDSKEITMRMLDIMAPIGKGQRGMIVSPPKAGKTTILKKIANSISTNHPEIGPARPADR